MADKKQLGEFVEELGGTLDNEADSPLRVVVATEDGEYEPTGVRFDYAARKVVIDAE